MSRTPLEMSNDHLLGVLMQQLARLVADQLREDIRAELSRLVAVQVAGDEWTCSVAEAARLLGVDRNTAYAEIRRTGTLAGVPVLRIGERYRVSKLGLALRLIGGTRPDVGAVRPGEERKEVDR